MDLQYKVFLKLKRTLWRKRPLHVSQHEYIYDNSWQDRTVRKKVGDIPTVLLMGIMQLNFSASPAMLAQSLRAEGKIRDFFVQNAMTTKSSKGTKKC